MPEWTAINPLDMSAGGGVISSASMTRGFFVSAPASSAWATANTAIFVPIRVPMPVTVYKLAIGAGSTASGNFDVGIYDASGNRLVSSGATAKGASTEHILDITDTVIGPGLYYLALAASGTNNYVFYTPAGTSPVPLQKARLLGCLEMATAYTLPATATFAAMTSANVPLIAAYLRPW